MNGRLGHFALLLLVGCIWGLTMPLTKIAVSTGHGHFGLILWQLTIGAVMMGAISTLRGRALPLHAGAIRAYVIIALLASVVPNTLSYQAIYHLPAGIASIMLSTVPMLAFPIALALALDRFRWSRMLGLLLGLAAVLLLVLPDAELQGRLPVIWLLAMLCVTACYAFEGNYVAKWGTGGCDPLELLWGASIVGALIVLPMTLLSGHWIPLGQPLGAPEQAQILSSVLSILAYSGYVWLVGRAGPVFAVQVSYVVTVAGVFWAALILGERYPVQAWLALVLMLCGMALVQPRRRALDAPGAMAQNKAQ